MRFSDIIGQPAVKDRLRLMAGGGRMPHALLLLGPEGSGKLAMAMAFAQYVLCANPNESDACGKCPSCIKASKLVHPDLHFSYPSVGSKMTSEAFLPQWRSAIAENPYLNANEWLQHIGAENKQGNITKEECVNIIRKLSLKTFESTHKVLILWLPEYLGKEGNRLLKLIEEPPDRTLFLIIGADSSRILPTILSRCQLTKVRPFRDVEIEEALLAQGLAGNRDASIIAFQADGNLGDALRLVRQGGQPLADLFLRWMRSCWHPPGKDTLKRTEELAAMGKEEQKSFFRYALHFVRQMVMARAGHPEAIRLPEEERKIAAGMAAQFDDGRLEALGRFFSDSHYAIERNANAKILFLNASFQVHALFRDKVRYLSTINQS